MTLLISNGKVTTFFYIVKLMSIIPKLLRKSRWYIAIFLIDLFHIYMELIHIVEYGESLPYFSLKSQVEFYRFRCYLVVVEV